MKETLHCYLQILSPVHMGCDEVYDPTSFVLDEETSRILTFDPFSFVRGLNREDKEKLSLICQKGSLQSILEIYKFLRLKTDVARQISGRSVPVCPGFINHYKKTLSLPQKNEHALKQNLNKFVINRTAFSPLDQRPYIPGSAIKGALRTAYLNSLPAPQGGKPDHDRSKRLEKQLLNYRNIQEDPFRLLKVSDFSPVGEAKTRLVYAVNEKKKISNHDARGPYQLMEVIQEGSMFVGSISVDAPERRTPINRPLTLGPVMASASMFFKKEKAREDRELTGIGCNPVSVPSMLQDQTIRIGRHSGAECLTIEGFRKIRIMGKNFRDSKDMDHATTIWLAAESSKPRNKENLTPFGWVGLNHLDSEKQRECQKIEKTWTRQHQERSSRQAAQQMELQQKALEDKIRQEELLAKQKKEQEKLELQEAKRQAEWDAMSPEEQDIARVRDPAVQENQLYEIYGRIDDFSPEGQIALAKALKECWVRSNKWKKKACSNKQWKKVQKIKKILEE